MKNHKDQLEAQIGMETSIFISMIEIGDPQKT